MRKEFSVRELGMEDYDDAYALWEASEGIGLSAADSRENMAGFLRQNPALSFVAVPAASGGRGILGAVLASCDGRRGFLYHLAVSRAARGQGIGRALVGRCLDALAARGMRKCHIFVARDNHEGKRFWEKLGWEERTTLFVMSHDVPS